MSVISFTKSNPLPTTPDATADQIAAASAATQTPLVVQGKAGQTAALQEWQTSNGTPVAAVTASGDITIGGTSVITTSIVNALIFG